MPPPRFSRARDRIVLALDVPELDAAIPWIERLAPEVGCFKVGLELYAAAGPAAVHAIHERGAACFLDLKLHDIPATVARTCGVAAKLGVRYLTIHASNGPSALEAAAGAVAGSTTQVLAVTVLTSLDSLELSAVGLGSDPNAIVQRLAKLAADQGVRGFVCSPRECALVRQIGGPSSHLVVPGIRPPGSPRGDQRRVATPADAMRAGADVLVVGRPLRDAADPIAAARSIAAEIASVTNEAP
ncbi:MAG: orotidine-5'-phosphate decarboxylase [Sandaracinaceae bacterium]|nr:orotidine-5'-phosphate decarboxylase [Sandaracinaceae bacterium]